MKKLIVITLLLNSVLTFAQDNHLVKVLLDGKPAVLNTKTGETEYINDLNYNSAKISENNSDIINTHVVEKGDTLYAISKKYGVSIPHIKSVNNLKSNVLSVNQVLKIGYAVSARVKDGGLWTVVKGDTLYAISKKTGVSISKIKALNNLENNIIVIDQKLLLK